MTLATVAAGLLAAPAAHAAFPGGNGRIAYWVQGGGVVHTVRATGSGDTTLSGNGEWPAYSADGATLFMTENTVVKRNADGSGAPTAVTNTNGDLTPAVSRDGTLVAFNRRDSQSNAQVWTQPVAGGTATEATTDANEHLDPAFSPTANRIAYVVGPVGQPHVLHVMDYDGSHDLTIPNTSGASDPDFSPDGTKIVYFLGGDIYVSNADGTGTRTDVDNNAASDGDPVFSPDGTKIAFDRSNAGIWTMDANGGNQTQIVTATNAVDPSWQPVAIPNTTLGQMPPPDTNSTTPTFNFGSDQTTGISYECRVDSAAFASCPSTGYTPAPLADGPHHFEVRAVLTQDTVTYTDPTPATFDFTVDSTPPATSIDAPSPVPGSTIATSTPTFYFASSETGSSFQCSVDLGAFSPCISGAPTATLSDGLHSFSVRATDAAGNADPHPPSESFTVDTTAPDTTITSTPPSPTNRANPRFFFQANDASATFECAIDGASWGNCASPYNAPTLADGSHTLSVRAIDAVGNMDQTPARDTVVVDTTPPKTKITKGPTGRIEKPKAKFAFRSNEADATFRCKLDTKGYRPCESPIKYRGLKAGRHTVHVQATDQAGNHDATPAVRAFRVAR